jgi:HAD superfamily hydrolase (TIGR01484 family)
MRYLALATDFDGTLAQEGQVAETVLATLQRLRDSGRKLILVTGREAENLQQTFASCTLFDWIVAENGAVLYQPARQELIPLAEPPPPRFAEMLRARGVRPLAVGHVLVATGQPNETTVLEVIRDLGLELEIIFNKGAVMVLPSGINKAAGLAAALERLELSPGQVVGIGDAENDPAFLSLCGWSVAVANALPAVKETVQFVTRGADGAGVVEVIEAILSEKFPSKRAQELQS